MRDRHDSQSRHVLDDTLIRYLDGELPPGETGRTQDHLQACWECRLRADRLSSTIPTPLPKMVPCARASNARQWPSGDTIPPSEYL